MTVTFPFGKLPPSSVLFLLPPFEKMCFQEKCRKTHTNEQTGVKTIIYYFLLRILIFLTGDKTRNHMSKKKKESVNRRMLGISEHVEKIFQ